MQHFVVIAYNLMIVKVSSNKKNCGMTKWRFFVKAPYLSDFIEFILLQSINFFAAKSLKVIDRYMQYRMRRLHILYQI